MGEGGFGARRAVVCDDDALVRNVVGQVVADAGFEVVGEAEQAGLALEVIERTDPDLVVLDLALRTGSGEELLRQLCARQPSVRVVVFSAYAADPAVLAADGATAVVEKPDFDGLARAVQDVAASLGSNQERRRAPRLVTPLPPPVAVTLSGFEQWESFQSATTALVPGDAILCADLSPDPTLRAYWDDVFRTDYRVALGRALATSRRAQDRVTLTPEGIPALLIVAGHPEAPTAVFQRLGVVWQREAASGHPVGAFGLVRADDDPLDRLDEVRRAVGKDGTSLAMV